MPDKKRYVDASIIEQDLRDQFAMAALTGIIALNKHSSLYEVRAREAYKYADHMLKERQDNG